MSRLTAFIISCLLCFSMSGDFSFSLLKHKIDSVDSNQQIVTEKELADFFNQHQQIVKDELMRDIWIDQRPSEDFYKFQQFSPFMQKVTIDPGSEIFMWGDLHGGVQSLIEGLNHLKSQNYINNQFKIIEPNCYFVFLGDYVDRGEQGIEVLYTLLRLKCANPEKVILLRGNHEDWRINADFMLELREKYEDTKLFKFVKPFYETLPCALVIGSDNDFILCCHGGIEIGVNPGSLVKSEDSVNYQLITSIDREKNLPTNIDLNVALRAELPSDVLVNFVPKTPSDHFFGFLWSDFNISDQEEVKFMAERGIKYGQRLTRDYLERMSNGAKKVNAVFRGHQHGDMCDQLISGQGLVSLWDGLVYTLVSSSEALDEEKPFSSFVNIKTASDYNGWKIGYWHQSLQKSVNSTSSSLASFIRTKILSIGNLVRNHPYITTISASVLVAIVVLKNISYKAG